MATRAVARNLKSLPNVGNTPYSVIRNQLIKLDVPEHLREIELGSPQICGHDAEIWRHYIARDIQGWEEKAPSWWAEEQEPGQEGFKPHRWWKLYMRLRQDQDEEEARDAERLMADLNGRKAEKEKRKSVFIKDPSTLPNVHKHTRIGAGPKRGTAASPSKSTLTFGAGSRTLNPMSKARREAMQHNLFSHRNSLLAVPTHRLPARSSRVEQAPKSMVEQARRQPLPPTAHTPRPTRPTATSPVASGTKRKVSELGDSSPHPREPRRLEYRGGLPPSASTLNRPILQRYPLVPTAISPTRHDPTPTTSTAAAAQDPPNTAAEDFDAEFYPTVPSSASSPSATTTTAAAAPAPTPLRRAPKPVSVFMKPKKPRRPIAN